MTDAEKRNRLVTLYQKMADLTLPECGQCRCPHSCCSSEYCLMAKEYARDRWGVTLVPTSHPTLPFMGEKGCIVAPHLRPICTLHTCEINSIGCKKGDVKWTGKYFSIRNLIEHLEWELHPL